MRTSILLGITLVVSSLLAGCGGSGSVTGSLAREVGICFGRVIDRSTRAGLEAATVEIFAGAIPSKKDNTPKAGTDDVNFVVGTTTAADDADTTLFNEAGMFRFQKLPTGETTGYRVRIAATNYATIQTLCTFGGASQDNSPIAEDLGDIQMVKGVTATVNLVNINTGAAIASCPVYAVPSTAAVGLNTGFGSDEPTTGTGGSQSTNVLTGIEVVATTDTAGAASLAGLNPLIDYTIVAPACDTDADGDYDFRTASAAATVLDTLLDSPSTFTIAMGAVGADDTPALVASSCGQFGVTEDVVMPGCGVAANGSLVFVFNYPVADLATGQLQLSLGGDAAFASGLLAIAGAVDFDGDETVDTPVDTAFTPALSAGNTVLTIAPTAALSANGLYVLDGTVSANVPQGGEVAGTAVGDFVSADFATLNAAFNGNAVIYAFPASDTTVADPTVDNYNGDDNGAGPAAVCLEFDELVVGSVQVEATTTGATTTVLSGPTRVNLNTGTLVNEGVGAAGVCGAAAGCPSVTDGTCVGGINETEAIKYIVPLGVPAGGLADDVSGAATVSTVTVYVDAQDYAGNRLQKELTLAVQ